MEAADSEMIEVNPEEIINAATIASLDLLPTKSRNKYENVYKVFQEWCDKHQVKIINEDVILAYVSEKSKTLKASSLWSIYSMLKACLNIKKNINIKQYSKVIAFLKKKSVGYRAKKSEVFSREQCDRFLLEAEDNAYLMMKVVLIIGIAGACRCDELCKLAIEYIEDNGRNLIIKIPDSKTHVQRTFIVVGDNNLALYRKYTALRPPHIQHSRLFIFYAAAKCTVQPVGIKTFSSIPRKIAHLLQLPNAELYTGHCLRRTSATLLVDSGASITNLKRHGGWKSATVAEGYVENSLKNKIKIAEDIQGTSNMNNSSNAVIAGVSSNCPDNSNSQTIVDKRDIPGTSGVVVVSSEKETTTTTTTLGGPDCPIYLYNPTNCTININISK